MQPLKLSLPLFVALLAALAITGCQRFQPQPLSTEQSVAGLDSRSLADASLKDFLEKNLTHAPADWPAPRWDFEMLTLAAFYFHPSLDVARAQRDVAKAAIFTAGGRPNPSIGVTPEYSFNPPQGVSPWLPSIKLDLPIETAGKRGHRLARAKHLSESAGLNIATAAWVVRSRLRASLVDWDGARQRERLLGEQQSLQEKIVAQLEQRFRAGTISSFELATARILLTKAQVELETLRSRTAEAVARVAEAIGVPVGALHGVQINSSNSSNFPDTELTSSEMRREALHTRADILAALAEYAASQSALQLELAKQYPNMQLGTGYQWDQGEHKWALGIGMELPVFNRNEGPIAEAKAKRTEAAARFEAVQAKALADIDVAVAGYRGARANLGKVNVLILAQQNQQAAIQAQFKAGAADSLEVLNAQAELRAAELLRLDAEARATVALGQLEDAIQRPFDALSVVEENPRMLSEKRAP